MCREEKKVRMIGANIRRIRRDKGFTQEELAEALDVTFQAVSAWERDEYKPDVDNLMRLADELGVSVSAIVEEKRGTFKTKDVIYNWEHMHTFVKATAKSEGMVNTLKALDFAVSAHAGQTRKNSQIAYIYHPLTIACNALAMDIREDDVVAACLLHDVVEDCEKTLDELPVDDDTKELVRLLTHEKTNDENREEVLDAYYKAIAESPKASLIKCMDRYNNLTTMSWGLSEEKIYRMIRETETYYPALLKVVKGVPEYNNAAWILKYQIESILDVYKRLM